MGIEPTSGVLQTPAWTTRLRRRRAGDGTRTRDLLHGKEALHQLSYARMLHAERRNRTADPPVFSRVLYQLSYLGFPSLNI